MIIKKLSEINDLANHLKSVEGKYQPQLTDELDSYKSDFTDLHVLKIVLWKLNRYPQITSDTIKMLNDLKSNFHKSKRKDCVIELLGIKGLDLPMVSTILRFLLPGKFQIIDQRAYRILYGKELKLSSLKESKAKLYMDYLDELQKQCDQFHINFHEADRLLYNLDKEVNKGIKLKNYG